MLCRFDAIGLLGCWERIARWWFALQLGMTGLNVLLIRAGWGDELPEEKESTELSHGSQQQTALAAEIREGGNAQPATISPSHPHPLPTLSIKPCGILKTSPISSAS